MSQIEAIYQHDVLKPLGETGLRENERVRLTIEPVARPELLEWLADVKKLQAQLVAEYGVFPDSTPDIAEDRMREV